MARRTGSSTIIHSMRKIVKMKGTYGAGDLGTRTSGAFVTALDAAIEEFQILLAADERPFEVDYTAPFGPEDSAGPP